MLSHTRSKIMMYTTLAGVLTNNIIRCQGAFFAFLGACTHLPRNVHVPHNTSARLVNASEVNLLICGVLISINVQSSQ